MREWLPFDIAFFAISLVLLFVTGAGIWVSLALLGAWWVNGDLKDKEE